MGRIGIAEAIVIILIIALLFGAKNFPKIAKAIAQAIKEFRKESNKHEGKK